MAQVQTTDPNIDVAPAQEVPAFLGLTQQQSGLLVALYNESDPEFAKQLPTAMPVAAQQLAAEFEKRNSVGKKLERAQDKYAEEYKLFEQVQQEAVERLSKTDMNIDEAAKDLNLDESAQCSIHDLLLGSLLYGGLRREPSGPDDRASLSPVASPNFEGAKRLLERTFDLGYTMAAVQIGSFYMQEEKLAAGKNIPGHDPKKLAYTWYAKAADQGNPMACHKIGYFLENGIGCTLDVTKAIEYYQKALDQGYPDTAHNLGLIYQGNTPQTVPFKDIKKSIEFLERAKQWGFAASANALGRLYLLMSKDEKLAEEAGNPGSDKDDYIINGIDLMEAQNYMELALVRGNVEAYTYLVRILRAKMAARVALENENFENFEKLSAAEKEKLIRQLAKDATPENIKHAICANPACDKKEQNAGDFKRCGQCQRVSYCSRECQKDHWKAGHKVVCKR
ncbi:uncharacterized protein BYT42DRAFT_593220 [Radiomyces spectabilis]|uniref:uncharacterized protein n=1 Tax=Radiomyces spectabilis TaxID=64574 RepID=UPI00221F95B6|nr:uncharacterized protein BYT42DRAFT_593220 [Radiomyces spectabilis]KAI8381339.1 hypothetical protein BYT42DRAFT_593220 [Radiomyces spectabilis]